VCTGLSSGIKVTTWLRNLIHLSSCNHVDIIRVPYDIYQLRVVCITYSSDHVHLILVELAHEERSIGLHKQVLHT
jgi:hypothetical protein